MKIITHLQPGLSTKPTLGNLSFTHVFDAIREFHPLCLPIPEGLTPSTHARKRHHAPHLPAPRHGDSGRALPGSLAVTRGISVDFFSSA